MLDVRSLPPAARALLVSTVFAAAEMPDHVGAEAYSYQFVYRAFAPLLRRLGEVREVDRPESRLDYAIRQAQRRHQQPLHLSFLPLHRMYLSTLAPNVAFPFWEFPRIPDEDFADNPRNNWARIAPHLDGILCASAFTAEAFIRAGVRVPVHVVPVPVRDVYFAVPPRASDEHGCIASSTYRLVPSSGRAFPRTPPLRLSPLAWAHSLVPRTLRATLPPWLDRRVGLLGQALRTKRRGEAHHAGLPPDSATLDLSGVVYTSLVNPFDRRKNWQDLLSAFLLALRDKEDATLVIKLVLPRELRGAGLRLMLDYYHGLGIDHRCQLAVVESYLSDDQMVALTRLSTYYLTAARAEGACLPAQDFLAAGRPVIAPSHTAMAEYLSPDNAFVVESHAEPTWWPHDPTQRIRTTWHRLVWQSLHDRIAESYWVAKHDPVRYQRMAADGRAQMQDFAGIARVWPRLSAALSSVSHGATALR